MNRHSWLSFGRSGAFFTVMTLVLAGCGGGSAPAPTQKPAAPAAPTTAPAPPAPTSAAAAQPKPAESSKPAAAAAAPTGPLPEVNVGVANNIGHATWFIGVDKGLFVKNGVDVKLKVLNSGPEISKAIQAGELQAGVSAFGTLAPAISQGVAIKGFFLSLNDPFVPNPDEMYAIIAQAGSNITKIEDLKGKKVGTTLGSTPDNYLKAALAKSGVPQESVEYVNATIPNMPSAFVSGLEAVVTYEPYGEQILAKHPGSKLISRGGGFSSQRIVMTSTDEWLSANRPLVEKVIAGMVEASYVTRTQPEVVGEVVPRWLSGVEPDIAKKAIKYFTFDPRISKVVAESWESENKLLIDQKKIKDPVPFNQAMDLSLFEDIPRKYPQFLSDLKPLP